MQTATALTWLEILPVFLDEQGICRLRPWDRESWRVPYAGSQEAAHVVSDRLAAADLTPALIHSTSWRQERGAVLLTHLAVLRPPRAAARCFERRRVSRRELARGTAFSAPCLIEVEHVVEHALRHLAWLNAEDEATRAALGPEWRKTLRHYHPEPFVGAMRAEPWSEPWPEP
jgi:hypothetical protein